jgi:short-subunit dehydrogenase
MLKVFTPVLGRNPGAAVVNVSSMGGYMPFPGQVIYGASKAAVKLLTEGLMLELEDAGIAVSVVYPGAVQTNIFANAPGIDDEAKAEVAELAKTKKVGVTAEQAARSIIRGMEGDRARILVGTDSWLIDKFYRLLPVQAARFLAWSIRKFAGDSVGASETGAAS